MPMGPPLLVYDDYVSCNLTSVFPFLFFSVVARVWSGCVNTALDSNQNVSVTTSKSYFEADNTNEIRLLRSCIIEWVTIITSLTIAIVSEHFWVAVSNVCKLQWRGLNTVDGGNLSATLSLAVRALRLGAAKCQRLEKNESAEQRPLHTCTHTYSYTLTMSLPLLFFCSFASLYSLRHHMTFSPSLFRICRRHNVCVRSLTFSSSRCSSLAFPLSFSDLPSLLSLFFFFFPLDALFDLFVLTFLFKQAHKPKPHPG